MIRIRCTCKTWPSCQMYLYNVIIVLDVPVRLDLNLDLIRKIKHERLDLDSDIYQIIQIQQHKWWHGLCFPNLWPIFCKIIFCSLKEKKILLLGNEISVVDLDWPTLLSRAAAQGIAWLKKKSLFTQILGSIPSQNSNSPTFTQ